MSLINLVHLTDRLFHQALGDHDGPDSAKRTAHRDPKPLPAVHEDQFTPSGFGSAPDAGLFQVEKLSLFSAAADFFLGQGSASPVTAPPAASPIAASSSAPPATTPTAVSSTTGDGIQDPLQALNSALTKLGLPQQDIAVIDRIANLIKDFNPTAFADLVDQFQRLADLNGSPSSAPGSPSGVPTSSGNTFQVQEISIRFEGINAQETTGTGANSQTVSFSAFRLQIQEVQFTLSNSSGQPIQVQAPAPAATASAATAAKA